MIWLRGFPSEVAGKEFLINPIWEFGHFCCKIFETTYTSKPLTVWITTNWKILKEMGISDCLICLLRNLYAGQEATVRTRRGTTHWFQIGKTVHQGCILSPRYLTSMQSKSCKMPCWWSTSWKIKVVGRNMNNLRYADDTTLTAESEELKSLLMKVKEESEKVGLKLNI